MKLNMHLEERRVKVTNKCHLVYEKMHEVILAADCLYLLCPDTVNIDTYFHDSF